jgi:hypothetical protein
VPQGGRRVNIIQRHSRTLGHAGVLADDYADTALLEAMRSTA